MNTGFWTIFKADLLFGACSATLTLLITVIVALYRRRKMSRAATKIMPMSPRALIIGGKELHPGHCPLCGQSWPLSGPKP